MSTFSQHCTRKTPGKHWTKRQDCMEQWYCTCILNLINFSIFSWLFLFFMFLYLSFINYFCCIIFRTGKIRFSGARKSVLLKASSRERCVPQNFVYLATFRGTRVHLIVYLVYQMKYLIGKMNQYNKILQFPHIKARRLSKKKKPRLCFTR